MAKASHGGTYYPTSVFAAWAKVPAEDAPILPRQLEEAGFISIHAEDISAVTNRFATVSERASDA